MPDIDPTSQPFDGTSNVKPLPSNWLVGLSFPFHPAPVRDNLAELQDPSAEDIEPFRPQDPAKLQDPADGLQVTTTYYNHTALKTDNGGQNELGEITVQNLPGLPKGSFLGGQAEINTPQREAGKPFVNTEVCTLLGGIQKPIGPLNVTFEGEAGADNGKCASILEHLKTLEPGHGGPGQRPLTPSDGPGLYDGTFSSIEHPVVNEKIGPVTTEFDLSTYAKSGSLQTYGGAGPVLKLTLPGSSANFQYPGGPMLAGTGLNLSAGIFDQFNLKNDMNPYSNRSQKLGSIQGQFSVLPGVSVVGGIYFPLTPATKDGMLGSGSRQYRASLEIHPLDFGR